MASRREFLQASLAAAGLGSLLAALPAAATSQAAGNGFAVHTILYEQAHPASASFARRCAAQGCAVFGMHSDDITQFWRSRLAAAWLQAPLPLAGMTTAAPLFCLEQLGIQYGLRVVYRQAQVDGLIAWVLAPNAQARRGCCID